MFIVSLFGGLASQMNQYAFSRFLRQQYPEVDVKIFDATQLAPGDKHSGYDLERVFGIKPDHLSIHTINSLSSSYFGSSPYAKLRSIARRVRNRLLGPTQSQILVADPTVASDDMYHLDPSKDLLFWANYANDYYDSPTLSKEISNLFQFPDLPCEAQAFAQAISSQNSVSIHIRRGDYSVCGFPLLGSDYYRKATDYIARNTATPPISLSFPMTSLQRKMCFLSSKRQQPISQISVVRKAI